jgi:DinB superfamily
MNAARQRMMGRLERQKTELIRKIDALPQEWLAFKYAPTAWSVLEVIDHLRKTELAVLRSCERGLKTRKDASTPSENFKAGLLLAMMRLPIKLKVPESVSYVRPDHVTSLQAVLDSWSMERLLLTQFVGAFPKNAEHVGLVFHPAVGWMTLGTTLWFLSAHLGHHENQLQRIKRACERSVPLGEKNLLNSRDTRTYRAF